MAYNNLLWPFCAGIELQTRLWSCFSSAMMYSLYYYGRSVLCHFIEQLFLDSEYGQLTSDHKHNNTNMSSRLNAHP